jgi:DNA polymerase III delta prime subunit
MLKAMQAMPVYKFIPKELLKSIIDISAGDIRSAINCTTLVAMQLYHSPRLKADISM